MRFLSSLLSLILTLLLLTALLLWSTKTAFPLLEGEKIATLLLHILAGGGLSWLAFLGLNQLYKKVHPAIYRPAGAVGTPNPGFTFGQALVSAFRSAVQSLAVPLVSLALLSLAFIPLLLSDRFGESTASKFLWLVAAEIVIAGVLGTLVQWGYKGGVLRLMEELTVSPAVAKGSKKTARSSPEQLRLRVVDTKSKTKLSERGAAKQAHAKRSRALLGLRDILTPLLALGGMVAAAYFQEFDIFGQEETIISLLIIGLVLLVMAWMVATLRLVDRTPLRQLRLGFGLWLHATLVAIVSPIALLFELTGRSGRPDRQWQIISLIGRWVNSILRSSRLFWLPVMLLTSFLLASLLPDSSTSGVEPLIFAVVGIVFFEISYRSFDRLAQKRAKRSNQLVFLRVFGDANRGQFLFSHLVPRWKGLGNVTCIAAPDVSVHQLEADIGMDLLFGRMRQRFLTRDEASVIGRHLSSDKLGAVWEDHCFGDTWMQAVSSLLTQNSIVMMDLRGFTPQRKGCIYELGVLRDSISIGAVVFLIDATTDYDFLKTTLERLWKNVSIYSPNSTGKDGGARQAGKITVFRMSDSKRKSANQLMPLLVEACVATEKYHEGHGQAFLKELIEDLQLLAADAPAQLAAVGNGRQPGKKILEAGYSSDHDLGNTRYLFSWGLINGEQDNAIAAVNEAVQWLRSDQAALTATAVKNDSAWQELREVARKGLKVLGKRRRVPEARTTR